MNDTAKRKKFPVLRLVIYIFVVTIVVTGVSFARYTTGSAGGDNARVAKFDVEITHNYDPINLVNGLYNVTITVTNKSEVPIKAWLRFVPPADPNDQPLHPYSDAEEFTSATVYIEIGGSADIYLLLLVPELVEYYFIYWQVNY